MKQLLPFKAKWRIAENDLIALKDSSNGCLFSTFVTTAFGIQYRLQIYPNGNRKENHEKVFVFLVLKVGNFKDVVAGWTIMVESANDYSRTIYHTFKESGGWGKCFCSTAELFDAGKGFIRDRKLELQIFGVFVFGEDKEMPFELTVKLGDDLWTNEESKDLKILVDGKMIMAHKVVLASVSPVFDDMLKSKNDANINELTISDFSFDIVERALKEIYGCNFSFKRSNIFNDSSSLVKFYDKFNISSLKDKHSNVLLRLNAQNIGSDISFPYFGTPDLGDKLWESEDTKDATILVDGKAIKVHKLVLAARSPKFAAILRTEPAKNQIEISDFAFNIVEMALRTIYQCINRNYGYVDELMKLLQFFYKYDCPSDKDDMEGILTSLISAYTVCDLTNCAISTKSTKLQEKCIEFLKAAYASNTPLCNSSILDKNVALKIIQNAGYRVDDKDVALKIFVDSFYQIIYTRKENASSSMMPASK